MAKKLFIKTYGCQMNVYDSARMADVLAPLGYAAAQHAGEADLVILNTCHIREKAAEKVYSELGRLRRLKQARADRGGRMLIAVAGCVAQAEGEEMLRRAPAVDLVLGPQTYHRLPELVARATRALVGTPSEDLALGLGALVLAFGVMVLIGSPLSAVPHATIWWFVLGALLKLTVLEREGPGHGAQT